MKHAIEPVMTAEVVAVRPSTPFRDLVRLLQQHRVGAIRHHRRLGRAAGTCAAEVMTRQVVSVPLGTPVADAARLMLHLGVKCLPVVDAPGRLTGIATRTDLLTVFLRPDPAIRWEVEHDVCGKLGFAPGEIQVEVRDGVVALHGRVERRSQVPALVRQVQAVEGVVAVDAGSVIEIVPEGEFLTYALGVPLRKMLDPVAAQARVPV